MLMKKLNVCAQLGTQEIIVKSVSNTDNKRVYGGFQSLTFYPALQKTNHFSFKMCVTRAHVKMVELVKVQAMATNVTAIPIPVLLGKTVTLTVIIINISESQVY